MLNKIKNPNFYESVHLLRGISALIVLLAHNFVWYCYLPGVNLFVDGETLRSFAQVGVTIFFVISGFVLPLSLIKSYELSDYPRFLAKRLIRVEPTYLASIALALGIVMLTTRIAPNAVPFHLDINQLLAHLLYLIPFTEFEWYSVVYWTLAIEFQFYLLIALLFPLWRRNYAFSIIVAVGFSGLFFLRGLFPEIGLFSKAPLFAVGMLSVSAVKTKKQSQRFFALVVAVIVASLYGALTRFYDLSASAIAAAALIVFWKPPRIKVRYLGTISYSLYVTHYPIIHLVNRGTRHFLGVEASPYLLYAIAFGNLILALLVSHFFYQLIEKPAQKLSKKVRYEKSKMKEALEQAATSEVSKL